MADLQIPPELKRQLETEARARDVSIETLIAQRLSPTAEGAPNRFACPTETCGYTSWTLSAVCPTHGQHVV